MAAAPGKYLTFILGSQHYGVPIATVREINRVSEITAVPRTPDFVTGVMNLRGKVVPVVDLRLKFSIPAEAYTRETCIVIIDSVSGLTGIIVDAVREVIDFTGAQLEPPPRLGDENSGNYVMGVGMLEARIVLLIDILSALSPENILKRGAIPAANAA
jgi:purine-binding chemotaxis protein CheW